MENNHVATSAPLGDILSELIIIGIPSWEAKNTSLVRVRNNTHWTASQRHVCVCLCVSVCWMKGGRQKLEELFHVVKPCPMTIPTMQIWVAFSTSSGSSRTRTVTMGFGGDVLHVSTSYAWRGRFSNVPQLIHVAKPTKTCAIHPIHSPGMKNQTETKGEFALISDLKTIKNLHFLMDTTR